MIAGRDIVECVALVVNVALLCGIYSKLVIMTYQHKLMWEEYARSKHINQGMCAPTSRT